MKKKQEISNKKLLILFSALNHYANLPKAGHEGFEPPILIVVSSLRFYFTKQVGRSIGFEPTL